MHSLIPDPKTMTLPEWEFLQDTLSGAVQYLEYGAGTSTRLAAQLQKVQSIVSVESDPVYVQHLRDTHEEIRGAEADGRLCFHIADIGPTQEWGHPFDTSKRHLWPAYALSPYQHEFTPDTILIDGRFRVACGLLSALTAPPSTTILIHDYRGRLQYHLLEQFMDITEKVGSFVLCHSKESFDRDRARRLLKQYLYEPADADPFPFARFRFRWKSRFSRLKYLLRKPDG